VGDLLKNLKYLNLLFLIVLWGANIFAAINGFFDNDGAEQAIITPASYTFLIWILIYLLLTGFVLFQFSREGKNNIKVKKIDWLFIISVLLNVMWLYIWENKNYILSIIIIFVYFVILMNIYITLEPERKTYSKNEMIFVKLPFSINFAWVTVAMAVNIANVLKYYGILGSNEIMISIGLLGIVGFITYMNFKKTRDWAYVATIAWGFVGILVNVISS
jgi:hypothetical protein